MVILVNVDVDVLGSGDYTVKVIGLIRFLLQSGASNFETLQNVRGKFA